MKFMISPWRVEGRDFEADFLDGTYSRVERFEKTGVLIAGIHQRYSLVHIFVFEKDDQAGMVAVNLIALQQIMLEMVFGFG
jgi:hypothetical protein